MQKINTNAHGFHLVDPSPWPLFAAISALMLTIGGVMYFHGYSDGFSLLMKGFVLVLIILYKWWRDIVREGTFEGQHTMRVQRGLRMGMILFIASEVMFFFAFFWAFFHSSLNPTFYIGGVWPPAYIHILNPWKVPLINTIILLTSGATVTAAHHLIVEGRSSQKAEIALDCTVALGVIFLFLQWFEYTTAPFSISDGVYGSIFYMTTGFHGIHVLIGTIFLAICSYRLGKGHFTREHHFGFEAAAWYWHFVDVVWLFLFITIYWWGS